MQRLGVSPLKETGRMFITSLQSIAMHGLPYPTGRIEPKFPADFDKKQSHQQLAASTHPAPPMNHPQEDDPERWDGLA